MVREEKIREEIRVVKIIETVFLEGDKTYGYRTIKEELLVRGINVSEYKIRKIMRENGLYPETRKKYKLYKKGKVGIFSRCY